MSQVVKYKFDEFEADVRAAELRRNGARVKLQMQPFQLLLALLERPQDVVTREELRQRLWPEDTFVDFDHGLNTAVAKLRDVLGDSASSPKYIETVAKRGYRFLAQADVASEGQAASVWQHRVNRLFNPRSARLLRARTSFLAPAAAPHEHCSFWRK